MPSRSGSVSTAAWTSGIKIAMPSMTAAVIGSRILEPYQMMEVLKNMAENLINRQEAEHGIDALTAPGDPKGKPRSSCPAQQQKFRHSAATAKTVYEKKKR